MTKANRTIVWMQSPPDPVVVRGDTPLSPTVDHRQAMTLVESPIFDRRVAGLQYAQRVIS
jgi:hypothetical protein